MSEVCYAMLKNYLLPDVPPQKISLNICDFFEKSIKKF